MPAIDLVAVLIVVFLTSIFGVVIGSNSFINIPVIILLLGVPAKTAIASNMFGLVFLSLSGGMRLYKAQGVNLRLLLKLSVLTVIASLLGALLVIRVPEKALTLFISILMMLFAAFTLFQKDIGEMDRQSEVSKPRAMAGYVATFVLGIYGGFFSAGYVTMLTLAYVNFFGMSFVEAVGITKFVNLVSSLVAVLVFAKNQLIDYRLALGLAAAMMVGAWIGASLALEKGNRWIRRMFVIVLLVLALRLLLSAMVTWQR